MARRQFQAAKRVKCPTCRGKGRVAFKNERGQRCYESCPACGGAGYIDSGGK